MTKISLGTLTLINNHFLDILKNNYPSIAERIENLEYLPMIKESACNALNRLDGLQGIRKSTRGFDSLEKSTQGEVVGALKSELLPIKLGLQITNSGKIKYISNNYSLNTLKECLRLQRLFVDAYISEITISVMVMLGYNVKSKSVKRDDYIVHYIEGVKNGESLKTVKLIIGGENKIKREYDGFDCISGETEENIFNAIYIKMGIAAETIGINFEA